jgi:hypothetical protein
MVNNQSKLTALIHELQHARSPLAQARVVARSWRTLRELSPTDRRLLARNLGFEGAEEILEGLSRKGGLAPAMLLRVLGNARETDESAMAEVLSAIRDPDRREGAIATGAVLASENVMEAETEEVPDAVEDVVEEQGSEEVPIAEEARSTPIFLDDDDHSAADGYEFGASGPVHEPEIQRETDPEPVRESDSEPEIPAPAPPPRMEVVDWSRWESATVRPRQAPQPHPAAVPPSFPPGTSGSGVRAVISAIRAELSNLARLRILQRDLVHFEGANVTTLNELVEAYPDGWVRRRALCAVLEGGIVLAVDDALELVSALQREFDRCWCLGILARRGELGGTNLERALDLVSSPASRRRLRMAAQS